MNFNMQSQTPAAQRFITQILACDPAHKNQIVQSIAQLYRADAPSLQQTVALGFALKLVSQEGTPIMTEQLMEGLVAFMRGSLLDTTDFINQTYVEMTCQLVLYIWKNRPHLELELMSIKGFIAAITHHVNLTYGADIGKNNVAKRLSAEMPLSPLPANRWTIKIIQSNMFGEIEDGIEELPIEDVIEKFHFVPAAKMALAAHVGSRRYAISAVLDPIWGIPPTAVQVQNMNRLLIEEKGETPEKALSRICRSLGRCSKGPLSTPLQAVIEQLAQAAKVNPVIAMEEVARGNALFRIQELQRLQPQELKSVWQQSCDSLKVPKTSRGYLQFLTKVVQDRYTPSEAIKVLAKWNNGKTSGALAMLLSDPSNRDVYAELVPQLPPELISSLTNIAQTSMQIVNNEIDANDMIVDIEPPSPPPSPPEIEG